MLDIMAKTRYKPSFCDLKVTKVIAKTCYLTHFLINDKIKQTNMR